MTTFREFQYELATLLRCNVAELPPVFQGERARVLAIGIFFDLRALYPRADGERLRDWFGRYTASAPYLKRVARANYRNDLQGRNVTRISKDSKQAARRRLAILEPGYWQRQGTETPPSADTHPAPASEAANG